MKDNININSLIDPVNIEETKKILNQMTNCVCKIKSNNGTGFFYKIPFYSNTLNILMTNYNIINENYIKKNKTIELLLNDEIIKLDLNIERIIYFNKENNITLIELKEDDKIKEYFELDDNTFNENISYENKSIYILGYSNGDNINVSYGILNKKDKYKSNIYSIPLGSPILNLKNNKLIGIYNNKVILLKNPLNDFINKNKYKFIKELGKGGFGNVNLVLNNKDNKYYALKEMIIQDEGEIKTFKNEINFLSKFNCDNIIKYYDSFKDGNKFYILMEYCDGQTLKNYIDENKKNNILIEENIIFNIIKQICLGIIEIHKMKIIHRDLKPENIFMDKNMNIKIGDFGISKQINKDYTLTKNKSGSEYYMAPEILSEGKYNEKSDIWSFGCIIYELFHLRVYYVDKFMNEIKKIDKNIYNYKWQNLINLLLQINYKKRIDINQVYDILEKMNINNSENNQLLEDNMKNYIIGEIYINKEDITKDIQIINSFENSKRKYNRIDEEDDYKYENEKEIKENIEIKIEGIIIEFSYFYKFKKAGKYNIKYSFKNNLTKTNYMFHDCYRLTNLDLSNFNIENVINMRSMFCGCQSLINLNLSNFKTKNVTNMRNMFYGCNKLTNLDLSNLNTENVTNMRSMFCGCHSLKILNLSNFNTEKVTNMGDMFYSCNNLTNLNLSKFNTQNINNMGSMFYGCNSIKILNLSNFDTEKVTNMSDMFYNCNKLTKLNLTKFNTKNVTNMRSMFCGCHSLINLNLSNFNTEKVTNMGDMFSGCNKLTNLDLSNLNTKIVTNMKSMFYSCNSLTSLNLSNFNTENVNNMSGMFYNCNKLTNLNLSKFNTKNVNKMIRMFSDCYSLKILNLSNFNTPNVTNMSGMFDFCNSLTKNNIITKDNKILKEFDNKL